MRAEVQVQVQVQARRLTVALSVAIAVALALGAGVMAGLGPAAPREARLDTLHVLEGERDADEFGAALAGWDVDDDGFTDIAVGAPGDSTAGRGAGAVHLFSGKTRQRLALLQGSEGERFGQSLAFIDADGDGFGDLVIGAPGARDEAGAVYVAPRLGRKTSLLLVARGERAGDRLGAWVSGAPALPGTDINGVLAGEPGHDPHGLEDAGSAQLLRLRKLNDAHPKVEVVRTWDGATAGARLGEFTGLTGDVDTDLTPDLLVGAPGALGPDGQASGALHVLSGDDGHPLLSFTGRHGGDLFGSSAATLRVHGEGVQYHEILVGARGYAELFSSEDGRLRKSFEAEAPGHDFGLVVGGEFRMESAYQFGFTISTSCFEASMDSAIFHGVRLYSCETLEEIGRLPAQDSRLGLCFARANDGQARDLLLVGENRPGRGRVHVLEVRKP
jgi:hypothetical protein